MKNKFIEIKGIGIPNKGAELMLLAAQKMLVANKIDNELCAEPSSPYKVRAKYGLFQKTTFTFKGRLLDWSFLANQIPAVLRSRYGLVTEKDVYAIIDASGFAYGDQWGANKARLRLSQKIKKWHSSGKKIILLPQAFGPFNDKELRHEMAIILQYSDLVYARDKKSLAYLNEIHPNKAKLAPDFTNLLSPVTLSDPYLSLQDRPCVIPNHKMLSMISGGPDYTEYMSSAVKYMQKSGMEPYILVHEGEKDLYLAREINERLDSKVEIIEPEDALIIKSIISTSKFVLSSRFHGLVSALSTGVPVIATGWSHKYYELLDDYAVSDFLLDTNASIESISANLESMIDALSDDESRENIKARIQPHIQIQKEKSYSVWSEITKILNKKND